MSLCQNIYPVKVLSSVLTIIDNYVDGKEFIRLSKEDIAKMVPPVGMANKIMRLQAKVASKSVSMHVHMSRCVYSLYYLCWA